MTIFQQALVNPWFYSAFFGPAVACLTLSIIALQDWRQPITIYILVLEFGLPVRKKAVNEGHRLP